LKVRIEKQGKYKKVRKLKIKKETTIFVFSEK